MHYRLLLLLSALWLMACGQSSDNAAQRPPPREHLVEVYRVSEVELGLERVRTGTLRPLVHTRIHAQEEGRIQQLPHYPGDRVVEGELLVELDDALLRAEERRLQAELNKAEQDLNRARSLASRQLIAAEELQRRETELAVARATLSSVQTRLSYTRLLAPFEGVISERLAEPGMVAARHAHLLTLIDPDSLVVDVSVSEQLLGQLQVGDGVGLQLDALPGEHHTGQISRLYPQVDEQTRRGRVEIRPDPRPEGARAGQLVRVQLLAAPRSRLMIPFAALRFDEQEHVFVVSEGRAQRRAVRSGERLADQVEILEGLSVGDAVVVRGFMGLQDGRSVREVTPLSERQRTGGEL